MTEPSTVTQQGAGKDAVTEEQRKKAQAALDNILATPMGQLAGKLGFTIEGRDPSRHSQKTVLRDLVDDIFTVSSEDIKRTPGLVEYGGANRADDAKNNLGVLLQEMFNKKRLVFDKDPVKNEEQFAKLKSEIGGFVENARMGRTRFNNDTIANSVHQKALELGAIKIEGMPPAPMAKVKNENIVYGKELKVNAGSLASVADAGFRDNSLEVYKIDENGALKQVGQISPSTLGEQLDGQYTVQAVNFKHNDVIEPGKNAKPPIDGYFVSNPKGEGYYLNSGAIDPAKSKLDFDVSKQPEVISAPAPVSPVPVVANMNGMNQGLQHPHPPSYM